MKFHLLGTAGYHPSETRHTSCYMIPEAGIVFDAGTGFFRVRERICTRHLHIFLSHAHLDHCVGLTFYLDVIFERNIESIHVYGQAEKLAAIRNSLFSQYLFPLQPDFQWVPLEDPARPVPVPLDGRLRWFPLEHPGGSIGFRCDWPGHSLAYVTDTTATETAPYVDSIRNVGLLVHECNFPDELREHAVRTGHSSLTDVAKVCRLANPSRTVLVHINPIAEEPLPVDSARHLYDKMSVGEDGMVIDF
jgi:ribonuclease Z